MLGFPLLYVEGMRLMMFRFSSFYCKSTLNPTHYSTTTLSAEYISVTLLQVSNLKVPKP